eukprot:1477115-Prymnesium_polylepis.3
MTIWVSLHQSQDGALNEHARTLAGQRLAQQRVATVYVAGLRPPAGLVGHRHQLLRHVRDHHDMSPVAEADTWIRRGVLEASRCAQAQPRWQSRWAPRACAQGAACSRRRARS